MLQAKGIMIREGNQIINAYTLTHQPDTLRIRITELNTELTHQPQPPQQEPLFYKLHKQIITSTTKQQLINLAETVATSPLTTELKHILNIHIILKTPYTT